MTQPSQPAADVLIRTAVRDESHSIAAVLKQAFIEYELLYTPAAFAATTPTTDQIQGRWDEGPVWAAVYKDDIVATVAAVPKGSSLYVRSMAVLPAATGRGIARRLLGEIETFAVEHHHENLSLSTTPFLKRAIHLYESFGFERSESGPQDLFGTPLFTMIKHLK